MRPENIFETFEQPERAMVLGNCHYQVLSFIWVALGQVPTVFAVGAVGCSSDIFCRLKLLFPVFLSLGDGSV